MTAVLTLIALTLSACTDRSDEGRAQITISGSTLGTEGQLLMRQIARFEMLHPEIDVEIRRTPDDATQRHQLFVQWLNARVGDPDVLQLDVVWTAEFAAAGWILDLDRFAPETEAFFPATIAANRWRGRLFALPWFVDVGMLYWRTDLLDRPPRTMAELMRVAREVTARPAAPSYGIVWQGARYEGLITTFVEYLGAFGGAILADDGSVVVDSPAAVRALAFMRDQLYGTPIAPLDVLTWHEEESRFAFQNGDALLMRNWPYAVALLNDRGQSRVAGRFAIAPMPGAPGGAPTATLGGAPLAINAWSEQPEAAYALVDFLVQPEQMLERAVVVGQYPSRPALFDDPRLAAALAVPTAQARSVIERATPRPVTPVYTQLSEILQIQLHRALVRQVTPQQALRRAAREMRTVLERTGVDRLMRDARG